MTKKIWNYFSIKIKLYTTSLTSHYLNNVGTIFFIYAFGRQRRSMWVSQVVLVVNLHDNAGDIEDTGSVPGWERSPGGGHVNPFQHFYLENPMDRGAWWATVHRLAKSWAWLKWLRSHTHTEVNTHIQSAMFNWMSTTSFIKYLKWQWWFGAVGKKKY